LGGGHILGGIKYDGGVNIGGLQILREVLNFEGKANF
jgi:hypothetical protein